VRLDGICDVCDVSEMCDSMCDLSTAWAARRGPGVLYGNGMSWVLSRPDQLSHVALQLAMLEHSNLHLYHRLAE
jgi:hypothetical protein